MTVWPESKRDQFGTERRGAIAVLNTSRLSRCQALKRREPSSLFKLCRARGARRLHLGSCLCGSTGLVSILEKKELELQKPVRY